MPLGFLVTTTSTTEIVAAPSFGMELVQAVAATPGWQAVGDFYLPTSADDVSLDVTVLCSKAGLLARVRLYDMTALAEVSGSVVSTTAIVGTRLLSGLVNLTGGRRYQMQCECTGSTDADAFATVLSGTVTSS